MKFVSTRLGLVRTVIKGKIDATPTISNNAITMIIINSKPAFLRSCDESKNNNFL
jgi:hypothetical protein